MKKVIIIGCPGSGKSTFGRKLKSITGLPLYHLDMIFWNSDKTTVSRQVFMERLQKIMKKPLWIIDGNYFNSMELRFMECDTVFFLDYPTEVCLAGVEARRGTRRSDMPWVEDGSTDEEFVSFINKFNTATRPEVMKLIEKYSSKNIVIFRSREDAEGYLTNR